MRKALSFFLCLFFVWNTVLGGMDALVLCWHQQGEAHLELLGKDNSACEKTASCESHPVELAPHHCPPCVDFALESAQLGPQLLNESIGLKLPQWTAQSPLHATHFQIPAPQAVFAAATPSRGPPATEPICELIRRSCVLRL